MRRRDRTTILTAHKLDPRRAELYVEGSRDKSFLDYLAPLECRQNCSIILIESVDVPGITSGGNRERVLSFLRDVEEESVNVRGLVDTDDQTFKSNSPLPVPTNAWLTDLRDLESYVMNEDNIRVALQLGLELDGSHSGAIYESLIRAGRWLAAVRLTSTLQSLSLPVSAHKWLRHVSCTRFGVATLNEDAILQLLLQAANISLKIMEDIAAAIQKTERELSTHPDGMVVHGKDTMAILTLQFRAMGGTVIDASPVMWMAFRNEHLSDFPVLSDVVSYLQQ